MCNRLIFQEDVLSVVDCKTHFGCGNSKVLNDLIFQHLEYDEVLQASEVSKSWYKLIGASEASMKKIQINVGKNSSNETDLESSTRQYINLKLHKVSADIIEYLSKHTWRHISMLIGSLTNAQCTQLLQLFAPAVIEFEFYIENIVSSDEKVLEAIAFPYLETITFRWTCKKIFEPFFGTQNKNLKNVTIELSKDGQSNAVKAFLLHNSNITDLSIRLSNYDYNSMFSEDFAKCLQIRLETLSFYWRHTNYVEPDKILNLQKFFLSQSECLKRLVFESTFDCKSVLELIINKLKTLEHLTIVDLDDTSLLLSDKKSFDLKPNPSIKQIDICVNWFISSEMFEKIVLASPNLEVLYIFELSLETLQFLVRNAKNLRHLVYEEIDDDCDYKSLISDLADDNLNRSIEVNWDQDFELLYPEIHQKMQFT